MIGAGNWGTALSLSLAHTGHIVRLWAFEKEVVQSIVKSRENALFMPGVQLPDTIAATGDLSEALADAEVVLTVMPSHVCRSLYEQMLPHLRPGMIFVSATKGIDTERRMRMSEVIASVVSSRFPPRLTVLSGPSFASEVARGDPTAVVVASEDRDAAQIVQREFSTRTFRIYTSSDVIGVELGGAVKNVIAIAAGVVEGLGLGHNPTAALITRGLAEMTRLACAYGGKRETLAGLAGMGDLVLTCTGELSRNHYVGYELGKGRSLRNILSGMKMVAEGVHSTISARRLSRMQKIEMPISEQIYQVLYKDKAPRKALQDLMSRVLKAE